MNDEIDRESFERYADRKADADAHIEAEARASKSFDFRSLEVPFKACPCGNMTTVVPCHECAHKVETFERARDADLVRGIPPRFGWARTGAVLDARVKVEGSRYYDSPSSCAERLAETKKLAVLLLGASGMGKTSLAVAAMRLVKGSFFVSAIALERARIEHQAGQGDAPLVARACRARLLVLDDLGQDKPSNVSAVEAVILARHDAALRTWVTTGLDAATSTGYPALEHRYNAGLVRRLTESGTARVIRFREDAK